MRAKKSLGQHFLTSKDVVNCMVREAGVVKTDLVLEIGPGKGILTNALLKRAGKVIALEKDERFVSLLEKKYVEEIKVGKLEILAIDALLFSPEKLRAYKGFTYKMVSNIPYYITGAILKKYLSSSYQPSSMVILVQKEVAQRIVASSNKESLLSLGVKAYGKVKIIRNVSKKLFKPVPKVDSSVLSIKNISREFFKNIDEKLYFSLLHKGFAHKRKKLLNNLVFGGFSKDDVKEVFKKNGFSENIRAEELTKEDWKGLCSNLKEEKLST